MYRILRRYNLSNGLIKYVSFPLNTSIVDKLESNIIHNDKKLDNNLCRARTKVKEYILCNDFKYFITITCNNDFINRNDLNNLRKVVTNTIRYYRKKYNLACKYILIPEKHKHGGYHLHGVIDSSFLGTIYINHNGYDSLHIFDKIGFSSIELIKDRLKVASYITKYISKDFANRGIGEHCYFSSRGLNKPLLINDVVYNNEFFDDKFFNIKNDFCYTTYSKYFPIELFLKKGYKL